MMIRNDKGHYRSGHGTEKYIVTPDKIYDRLDVKNCLLTVGRSVDSWRASGLEVLKISDVLKLKEFDKTNTIITRESDETVRQIIVRYNGDVDEGDEISASDTQYLKLFIVKAGDLVISNICHDEIYQAGRKD